MKTWLQNWRIGIIPGLSITGLVILARLLGALQPLEWKALDLGLRWRLAERTDSRITIVTITEDDIQTSLDYPISDKALAELIEKLQDYKPRVIGVDIFRDKPVGEGFSDLEAMLQASDNVIGINKISGTPIPPPPMLPEAQVGFADAILDDDGFLRRSLLASADAEGNYRFSLTIRLVEKYLIPEGLILKNGIHDPETMRFGWSELSRSTSNFESQDTLDKLEPTKFYPRLENRRNINQIEIPRFYSHTGGYIKTDYGGNQVLINFRSGRNPFQRISYKELMSGQIQTSLIEDRVVLIGYTAESIKDFVSSAAIADFNPSLVPGVEVQAHAVSQILSAVYDSRSFLKDWPDFLEYIWIFSGGLLGFILAQNRLRSTIHITLLSLLLIGLILFYYGLLLAGWWIPLVPASITFLLNAIVLYPFYRADFLKVQSQLDERQQLIDWAYNTIHNGPLQVLAGILSTWQENQPAPPTIRQELQKLNQELRGIYEAMRKEMLLSGEQLVLTGQKIIELSFDLHELLYEIYQNTIERHRDFFSKIIHITRFESMVDKNLTLEQKRELGRFLEEALLNVYKYAKGTTRLTITCSHEGDHNLIQVIDNGEGFKDNKPNPQGGYGTRKAEKLARSLRGDFERTEVKPKGVCCELRWPTQLPAWRRWFPI